MTRSLPLSLLVMSALCLAAHGADKKAGKPTAYVGKARLFVEDHKGAPTFRFGQPIIGTSYFYWYDIHSGEHIRNPDGSDAMTTHPPRDAMKTVSYKSDEWHYQQLQDIRQAGIDFLLPVYWGEPGVRDHWSDVGLAALVRAHDRMQKEHTKDHFKPAPPSIGMFYDTSTLQFSGYPNPAPRPHVDLTTAAGREWFYTTVRQFFNQVPPAKWARIDGKPIVFLYGASYAKKVDERALDDLRARFRADMATDLFLVRNDDWPGRADAWYTWRGGAELTMGDHVADLGPGYDHSAVRGRKPFVVDRENGKYYERQWERLLAMSTQRRPWIVHVETWNEWHEGTDIAPSDRWEDLYIRLTNRYAESFHKRERLAPPGPYGNRDTVGWAAGKPDGIGVRTRMADGCFDNATVAGRPAIVGRICTGEAAPYVYFEVDNSFLFDAEGSNAELAITFLDDGGCECFRVDFDSFDPMSSIRGGAFRTTAPTQVSNSGNWRTETLPMPAVRFANRANGADFRVSIVGGKGTLTIAELTLRKVAPTQ